MIKHIFENFKVDDELLCHIKNVHNDTDICDDDINRWNLEQIISYKHDYQIKTYVNDNLASISFFKWYNDYLRIFVGMYVLKKYRKYLHRFQFQPDGGAFALIKQNVKKPKGYFGTFYAKNKKLSSLVYSLKEQKHRGFGSKMTDWDNFAIYHNEPIIFRYVPQWVMYWNQVGNRNHNLRKLYDILKNDKK